MNGHPFYIADVFAEKKYTGNQLAVIRNASDLSSDDMLSITREMNYSESTFILSDHPRDGGYDVRIFTPGGEVPFAGHPTLGTAALIRKKICPENPGEVILNLKAGRIPVSVENDVFWMEQLPPVFGDTYAPSEIAPILGIDEEEIETSFPIQWVSTGLATVIVPLRNLDAVKKVSIQMQDYVPFIDKHEKVLFLVFARETLFDKNNIHDRVLAPCHGVAEDPATGSANGCLTGYLVNHRCMGQEDFHEVRVEQGYEINRPSLLLLSGYRKDDEIKVHVGGNVIFTAEGTLF